ncbi:MAG: class II aldolase/adducin family protein, partial [Candidatus Omnitrophica bacterium]|nr:class II aldolase/adducin family protein [Candidatus Omnitrophota bacterium]
MSEQNLQDLKKSMVAIGRLLWEKDLVHGLNGNISVRVDDESILITGHKTCLGLLKEKDILHMKLDGELLEEGKASSETLMHTAIYQNFSEHQAVLHTHTTYTNGFFLKNEKFIPQIFEAKFYLGEVTAIAQSTPSVTDARPIVEAMKQNSIIVLKNHGVVAAGKELFDCFILIQALEEGIKTNAVAQLYQQGLGSRGQGLGFHESQNLKPKTQNKKYKLFSREQIDAIVDLVNKDAQMKELG